MGAGGKFDPAHFPESDELASGLGHPCLIEEMTNNKQNHDHLRHRFDQRPTGG